MTEIWIGPRKVASMVIRDVDNNSAKEFDCVYADGTHETFWVMRGEY